jgi:hypothetical protein
MAPANPMPPQALPLGQPLDVTLSANIFQAPMNCEIGGDPAPCAGFTIDTPRAGSLLIEMRFTTTPAPVFMYMYRPVPGNVVDLQNVTSSQSPLLAQSSVGAERIYLHAGLDMPWANSNGQVQFQLLATLQ